MAPMTRRCLRNQKKGMNTRWSNGPIAMMTSRALLPLPPPPDGSGVPKSGMISGVM